MRGVVGLPIRADSSPLVSESDPAAMSAVQGRDESGSALVQAHALQNVDQSGGVDRLVGDRLADNVGDGAGKLVVVPGVVAGEFVNLPFMACSQQHSDRSGAEPRHGSR